MTVIPCLLTANPCYTAGRTITPKGVMVHSTGANNKKVARYVQPLESDPNYDGQISIIGFNKNHNDWNNDGLTVCTHAFIGELADGSVGCVQTLPWNWRGWHAGTGTSGSSANNTHIAFEICEDALTDQNYFNQVYNTAVELVAELCLAYSLDPLADGVVICHSEGYTRGIASNHADVMHWFPKFGKSMGTFRSDVAAAMGHEEQEPVQPVEKTIDELAQEVIQGKWGNGTERTNALTAAGYDAKAVQDRVNQLLGATTTTKPTKTIDELAQEVIQGKWGNGTDRTNALTAAGYDAKAVQDRVNQLLGATTNHTKTIDQLAQEVIQGKWGNGAERTNALTAAGYDAKAVQDKVNQILLGN